MSGRWRRALLAGLVVALTGCAGVDQPEAVVHKATRLPARVAVLPFALDLKSTADPIQHWAAQILREQFYNRFAALGYLDLDLVEVDRRLHGASIPLEQAAVAQDPKRLATILGVDGLVVGRVNEVSAFKGLIISDTRLGGTIKLISPEGATLWESEHTESLQGGLLLRAGELLRALEEVESQFKDERHLTYLKLAEEYSRKVVATVPQPTREAAETATAPRIERVTAQVATGRVLQAGDQVRVTVEGDPDVAGTFQLGLWRTGLPLVEVSKGRYVGAYTVHAGDAIEAVPVMVRLTDIFGLSTSAQVAGLTLTVDAAPPPPPEEVVAEMLPGQGAVVRWRTSGEASGVALYRSCPPGGGLTLVGHITEDSKYTDRSGPVSAGSCSYQAAAIDAHGNLSYPAVATWR